MRGLLPPMLYIWRWRDAQGRIQLYSYSVPTTAPWSDQYVYNSYIPFEKPITAQLLGQEIPRLLWNRSFITVFTKFHCCFLSWDRRLQSTLTRSVFKIHFNIILPSTSRFSKWFFPSCFFVPNMIHKNIIVSSALQDWLSSLTTLF
jgi:hypothetical protein